MMAEKQYNFAVDEYVRLCEARQDHSFWIVNIVDATIALTDNIAWQNFYSFLSNDKHVFKNFLDKTLGQCIEEGAGYPESPIEFDIEQVQNGDVTHVKLTPNVYCINKKTDGKPLAIISPRVQKKESGLKFEGKYEKRKFRV
jgi:hypothetical protein